MAELSRLLQHFGRLLGEAVGVYVVCSVLAVEVIFESELWTTWLYGKVVLLNLLLVEGFLPCFNQLALFL